MTEETRKDLVFYYRYNKDLQISAELTGLSVRIARRELERLGEIAVKPNANPARALKAKSASQKSFEEIVEKANMMPANAECQKNDNQGEEKANVKSLACLKKKRTKYRRTWQSMGCSFSHFILSTLREPMEKEMAELYALCGRIILTRKNKKVPQKAVAKELDISLNHYCKIECGKRVITPQALAVIMAGIDKAAARKEKR